MSSKIFNILLWLSQVLVAAIFFFGFYGKIVMPQEEAVKLMPWVVEHPGLAKFTGIVDLLAALGLLLPGILRIQPKTTIYAAYGGMLLLLAGMIFHILRGESSVIGLNIFAIAILIFISWARTHKAPIYAK